MVKFFKQMKRNWWGEDLSRSLESWVIWSLFRLNVEMDLINAPENVSIAHWSIAHKILVILLKFSIFSLNKLYITQFSKDLANFVRNLYNLASMTNNLATVLNDKSSPHQFLFIYLKISLFLSIKAFNHLII